MNMICICKELKTTLSIFDDKRNYLDNVTSIPWN